MKFGDKLRIIRLNRGLNQTELAKLLGTTKQCICRYERSEREPSLKKAMEFAEKLGISVTDLVDENIIMLESKKKEKDLDDQLVELLTQLSKDEVTEVLRFVSFLLSKRGG